MATEPVASRDPVSTTQKPIIVIVGPTASGKSKLAVELAERYSGEIICADSRTIYKGMDIGTAKPSSDDRRRVPHYGLDIVEPGERFTAADFKRYTVQKVAEIQKRGHTPFIVGGTGLYVNGFVYNYSFGGDSDQDLRRTLSEYSIEQLHNYCKQHNILLLENTKNKRYLIRKIEQESSQDNLMQKSHHVDKNVVYIGIKTDREVLRQRIHDRSEHLFVNGVVEEASLLGKKYGWDNEAMTGNIYRLVHRFVEGELTFDKLKQHNETVDWQLAKRQLTWFKRDQNIIWLNIEEARDYVSKYMSSMLDA